MISVVLSLLEDLRLVDRVLSSKYGLDKIAEKVKEHDISGLVIIGGFEVSVIDFHFPKLSNTIKMCLLSSL